MKNLKLPEIVSSHSIWSYLPRTIICCYYTYEQDPTSYFGLDCFHFSERGHCEVARALWNNMVICFCIIIMWIFIAACYTVGPDVDCEGKEGIHRLGTKSKIQLPYWGQPIWPHSLRLFCLTFVLHKFGATSFTLSQHNNYVVPPGKSVLSYKKCPPLRCWCCKPWPQCNSEPWQHPGNSARKWINRICCRHSNRCQCYRSTRILSSSKTP